MCVLLVPLLCYVQHMLFLRNMLRTYMLHLSTAILAMDSTAQRVPSVLFPSCQRCISVQGNGMGSSFAIISSSCQGSTVMMSLFSAIGMALRCRIRKGQGWAATCHGIWEACSPSRVSASSAAGNQLEMCVVLLQSPGGMASCWQIKDIISRYRWAGQQDA